MNDRSEKFKLVRTSGSPVTEDELLADIRKTAERIGEPTIGQMAYRKHGQFDDSNIARRFGSWNSALNAAHLPLLNRVNIDDSELFENILRLWQHYGRQPRRRELAVPPSAISASPYKRRFGSWTQSLEAFVDYANESDTDAPRHTDKKIPVRTTSRDPSLRLRWAVLKKDNFTCRGCGASPAKTLGIELHVDHVVPWSRGGDTVFENLQTLCEECNLGKSNT